MREIAIAAVLALFATTASARVVVFGVDGGSWPLVDRGVAAGTLPNFAALAQRGVTAEMTTVEPVISPTVWTSIATGRSPEAHGVGDFFRNRTHVRVPTVFERMSAHGLRVGLQEWLITWPPRTLPNGFVITDWLRRDDRVTPPDVFARAGLTPYLYTVTDTHGLDGFAAAARAETTEKPAAFLRLAETFQLDVGAVTFYSADATGHRFWRAAFPDEFDSPRTADEERHAGVIDETMRGIDAALGQIVASLGPDDSIVIVSDHGFEALPDARRVWSTRIEEQLTAADLDAARDGIEIDGQFLALTLRLVPGPSDKREPVLGKLVALLESVTDDAGTPLFDVDVFEVAERPPEARASWDRRLRAWVVKQAMVWWYGITLDRPAYAFVLARPRDAALAALWPSGTIRVGERSMPADAFFALDDFTGGHNSTALFLAAGGPIAHRPTRDRVSVLDVAPLLLHLAGLPVPDDLEGAVPERMLDADALAARPVRKLAAAELPGLPEEPGGAQVDDAVLMERLRALGYVQ